MSGKEGAGAAGGGPPISKPEIAPVSLRDSVTRWIFFEDLNILISIFCVPGTVCAEDISKAFYYGAVPYTIINFSSLKLPTNFKIAY
jgi:hypothetical protein